MSIKNRIARVASGLVASMALVAFVFAATAVPASAEHVNLDGVIHIDQEVDGSYVRIQQPGNPESASFLENSDSGSIDQTYTPLEPSETEELELGNYQVNDGDIVDPVEWEGIPFDIFTLPADPTGEKEGSFDPPSLEYDDDSPADELEPLTGDFSSWHVAWGGEEGYWYSVGANSDEPGDVHHPDGNLEGTYNENTKEVVLDWSSVILDHYPPPGGTFDGFVSYWHIVGTFEPNEEI